MPLPRPPIKTITDFVVFCFVSVVVAIILIAAIGVMTIEILHPERDTDTIISALLDITTTLIGALVGFIAGKGQGRSEMHDEISALSEPRAPDEAT